jgi:hypothetical protein
VLVYLIVLVASGMTENLGRIGFIVLHQLAPCVNS